MRDEPVATAIDAVTAWRGWSLVEEDGRVRLSSLTRPESWMPRTPYAASCSKRGRGPAPQRRCRCGVYATTTPEDLGGLRSLPGGVVGEVSLWGRVIEHGHGFRAELGYPGRLGLVCAGCLAEGTGRRADVVERLETGGRIRLLPWCADHAPSEHHAAARDVESALLSDYAVDPVSDEMIGRIHARRAGRPVPERRSRRRVIVAAAVAAATIALATLAVVTLTRPDAPPSGASASGGVLRFSSLGAPSLGQPIPRTAGLLTNYPPIRIALDTNASGAICGHADGGDVEVLDCRADGVNAYVFAAAPTGTRRPEMCTQHADAVTTRGDQTLCWRRMVFVP